MLNLRNSVVRLVLLALMAGLCPSPAHAEPCPLAQDGRAVAVVVVAEQAAPPVREAAQTLADYLGRITGASFALPGGAAAADGGLARVLMGLPGDFPELGLEPVFADPSPAAVEQYLLRSEPKRLLVIGAGPLAVRHAVWDLLHRLGHRQFFPGEVWEVTPRRATLAIEVDTLQRPAYLSRGIWVNYGHWGYNQEPLAQWHQRNRTDSAFALRSGHAYENIVRKHKDIFDQHPEYRGLVNGERRSTKMCVGNPAVRELVVNFALKYFEERPLEQMISVDPSDGGGWCECEACAAVGSPSDRAITLANDVASAVESRGLDKYVGLYAYNEHAPPPKVRPHPRVIVTVATAFTRGTPVDSLITGWREAGLRQFGIREYFSINTWDRDLPGAARAARLSYIATTIPHYHHMGARFYSSESADNWGPCGLGYYIAARLLWDPSEADRVEALRDDFLQQAFGPVAEVMRRYYALIDGDRPVLLSVDLVGRMYRQIDEARRGTSDPAILARLDHLLLYTRYVELFRQYQNSAGDERQQGFEAVIRHAYRMRATQMLHVKALYRDLPNRDRTVTVPEDARWQVPEGKNPWKDGSPWSAQELSILLAKGIEANPVASFEPVRFTGRLRPLPADLDSAAPVLKDSVRSRGRVVYYTWAAQSGTTLTLDVTAGLIAHYRDRGPARLQLVQIDGDLREPIADAEASPTGDMQQVTFTLPDAGLYAIEVSDGNDATSVVFPPGAARTTQAGEDQSFRQMGRRSGYFFVPRGTKVIGGFVAEASGTLHEPDGKLVMTFEKGSATFEVPVPAGLDGRCWSIRNQPGAIRLMTVPPYMAAHPSQLLVPEECLSQKSSP